MNNKVALITGVSRKNSIGFAIAKRLAESGINLFLHSFAEFDKKMLSPNEIENPEEILNELRNHGIEVDLLDADFSSPDAPALVMNEAVKSFNHIDILILNHTYDSLKTLEELTVDEIDRHLFVNIRAPLLLIRDYAKQHDGRSGGRIIQLTSGQHLGPMPHLAYAATKGAMHQLTASLSEMFIKKGITVNTVNPGPTKTYIPSKEIDQAVLKRMPQGRWGEPDDAARLISWLVSDEAKWITGQIIDSEGGFQRG